MSKKSMYPDTSWGGFVFLIFLPGIIFLVSLLVPSSIDFGQAALTDMRRGVGAILTFIGIVFVIWSNIDLFFQGKGGPADLFTVAVSPRTKNLVTEGPYRYTRNPMVFGMNSIYVAFALFINSLSAFFFCLFFICIVVFYLVLIEEKRLLQDFGDEYSLYRKRVSMIIPFFPKEN